MTKRRNHALDFKTKLALAALRGCVPAQFGGKGNIVMLALAIVTDDIGSILAQVHVTFTQG